MISWELKCICDSHCLPPSIQSFLYDLEGDTNTETQFIFPLWFIWCNRCEGFTCRIFVKPWNYAQSLQGYLNVKLVQYNIFWHWQAVLLYLLQVTWDFLRGKQCSRKELSNIQKFMCENMLFWLVQNRQEEHKWHTVAWIQISQIWRQALLSRTPAILNYFSVPLGVWDSEVPLYALKCK